ncbi:rfaE bifunctional protein nucleotidyltransferase chain/domain [Balneicella halophila]|uniref:D-glycero-beta-D-manno-heptose 1-phosphate adenylyltransferase n=1 Tax=Balneicella halophila TaxID=1537566 RepID=A0A7L4UQN7_BALHA|nr:D-glycero-beta-D-manno-heptose 1-phosphate adenylyltransferase [Balneicella halophila]PVX52085.1 rfaE bifunctional protein nucleotidyltransferase chain/domain [Balneicella halophila]
MKTPLTKLQAKIFDSSESAKSIVKGWKSNDKKIVFTNGCFDILHQGHVVYLAKAASLGDKLIVGLNTDASVKRLKGENRPLNGERERAIILAALGFVDLVVFFEDDTPYELIKELKPNILTKGADYNPKNIVGYDIVMENGGSVETIALEEGFSTTNIIEKIRKTL